MPLSSVEINKRYIDRLDARMRAERGNQCEEEDCEEMWRLEWAHVKPTKLKGRGRGRHHRILDVRKNPTSYKLLCRPCHMRRDEIGAAHGPEDVMEQIPF